MSQAAYIRAQILKQPEGTIFVRRDFLCFGTTYNVDKTLGRLRDKELIVHLAWGTYWIPKPGMEPPSYEEIAQARITSFGRKGVSTARAEAQAHRLTQDSDNILTYEVNASSSQFNILPVKGRPGCLVILRGRVARKMRLAESAAGRAIKALWYVGPDCTPLDLNNATINFSRSDRAEFRSSHKWMPAWLSDFAHTCRNPPKGKQFG